MRTRLPLILGAAAAVAAVPAAASAATPTLSAGPVKVAKGYSLSVVGSKSSALVSLSKAKRGSSQTHTVMATRGVSYSARGDLSSATLKASFGAGQVTLRFRATGRTKTFPVPRGCKGKPSRGRAGVLSAGLKARVGSATVKAGRIKATLLASGNVRCGGTGNPGTPGGSGGGSKTLMVSSFSGGASTSFIFSRAGNGKVSETASTSTFSSGYSAFSSITAPAPSSAFTVSGDGRSASAKAAGPFLAGALSFTGTPAGRFSTGTVTGSFSAKFDFVGTRAVPSGASATLSR